MSTLALLAGVVHFGLEDRMMNMHREGLGHEMRDDGMVRTAELASLKYRLWNKFAR